MKPVINQDGEKVMLVFPSFLDADSFIERLREKLGKKIDGISKDRSQIRVKNFDYCRLTFNASDFKEIIEPVL